MELVPKPKVELAPAIERIHPIGVVLLSLIYIEFPLARPAGILFAWFLFLPWLHSGLKIP